MDRKGRFFGLHNLPFFFLKEKHISSSRAVAFKVFGLLCIGQNRRILCGSSVCMFINVYRNRNSVCRHTGLSH